ncbi:MAG: hypothetical protein O8C66_04980 [Candidatus Methanoperedens sp.]|nr:hypothetical protein [Candidatus Methanoperedens sp.]MCZ7369843.1 hypothetical protein [Candidatus Methanoperedens sp.]
MRLSKNNLLIIWIVPIILGLGIMYSFWIAIMKLYPLGMTTYLIFNQLILIGAAVFLGIGVYWSVLIYYVYLLQENEVLVQNNFTQLASSGTQHLENAKKLINQVLKDIKTGEDKLKPHQQ